MGTLTSVMASVWTLLKDNLSLFFGSLTTILSIVLGGGTAVLNFLLSLVNLQKPEAQLTKAKHFVLQVVFFTALFYLLNSSGSLYKPVELITNFSPTNGKRFGEAFEAAVNGVFRASFKMAVFYGSWTWLIHNLFQVKIVYLPSGVCSACRLRIKINSVFFHSFGSHVGRRPLPGHLLGQFACNLGALAGPGQRIGSSAASGMPPAARLDCRHNNLR